MDREAANPDKFAHAMPSGVAGAMSQVKAALKQQMDAANQEALMIGIQSNCLKACDPDGRRKVEKKCIENCAARYIDAWNVVSKSLVNVNSQMG
jgi:hypothetical protein